MKLLAACAFGLEAVVKRELQHLGFEPRVEQPGRVSFEGDWEAVCQANIWMRVADRVLIQVAQFPAADFDALFETVKALDWSEFIPRDAAFPVSGRSRKSQLTSVPAVQRSVKRAVVEGMMRAHAVTELPETGPKFQIDVALLDDVATLTLDTTGASLHKRGYRRLVGAAPLKETLASAMIQLSVWKAERPLVDPFCGSGTIPIEAAMLAQNRAPGLNREFTCSQWPQIPAETWTTVREQARAKCDESIELQIIGTDQDPEVLQLARTHAANAGVGDKIHFQQKSFHELRSKREFGCVITNPPYGERLNQNRQLDELYASFPAVLQRLPTWSHFVITSVPLEKIIRQSATRRRKLFNGRIECMFYQYLGPRPPKGYRFDNPLVSAQEPTNNLVTNAEVGNVDEVDEVVDEGEQVESRVAETVRSTKPEVAPVFGGLTAKDHEQAELFRSRLVKRARHLRKWPTKRNISCFRIYERDIPELPLVVDRYGDHLHITEYDRPHDRGMGRHAAWLELMKKTAASALEIPIKQVHLKSRNGQRGKSQYQSVDSQRQFEIVREAGLEFLVNLTDYVDTGLFLDHRVTRSMVRKEASGKRFLNLFAYTGAFSVYAAAGQAVATTTVDLSKNYLDWAARNMRANGFDGPQHQFVRADTMDFVESAVAINKEFDLAVIDPPTFSNSKQTEDDWEIQTGHVGLLMAVKPLMTAGATIYFSSNFRRFKLDEEALSDFKIIEISKQTVPEDFRNKRIHRCWKLICPS